jgi:hypothetical protein
MYTRTRTHCANNNPPAAYQWPADARYAVSEHPPKSYVMAKTQAFCFSRSEFYHYQ